VLTSVETTRDERPAYRPYHARVSGVVPLTPHFTRVTFTDPAFAWFGADRLDQRVKIVFPAGGTLCDLGVDDPSAILEGSWYGLWRALPAEGRSPFRTYTIRDIRPDRCELDVVFVDHGPGGPAADWLTAVAVGDEVLVIGPDARSLKSGIGIDWHPGRATELLLAGDETAAPAICGILESLPAGVRARAFIEVPSSADVLEFASRARVTATWLGRDGVPIGDRLTIAVREWVRAHPERVGSALTQTRVELADIDVDEELLWDSPAGGSRRFYAWLAGESAVIKSLRRFLVTETGVDRGAVAFMGYWRRGKSEAQ
jgi:NADPH-dependent ferric siderophore reductase